MQSDTIHTQLSEVELVFESIRIKHESSDTTIIQLKGKLVHEQVINNHIVIALHAKDAAGQYVHLQQYEFEYYIDQMLEKSIDISVLVISELQANEPCELEVKLLVERDFQQWEMIQRYTNTI